MNPLALLSLWAALATPHLISASPTVTLTSSSPIVLDDAIVFRADLQDADDYKGDLIYRWSDNASPAHWREDKIRGHSANLSLVYPSQEYEAASYTMTVIVYEIVGGIFREQIAAGALAFDITRQLNGQLSVDGLPTKKRSPPLVSSQNTTRVALELYDPNGFLSDAKLVYYWFVNDTNFGVSQDAHFDYQFSQPGVSNVEASIIAYFPNKTYGKTSLRGLHPSVAQSVEGASSLDKPGGPPGVKFGIFRVTLESRDPVKKVNISGSTWLKHGELLDIEVDCDGSGPWLYCWSIVDKSYNITGNETCDDPASTGAECSIPIMWYFRDSGNYDILVQVSNGVTDRKELVHVNIYEVHRQTPVGFVIFPVCSALAVVIAIVSGLYACYTYKRNLSVEIADFDFNPEEEDSMEYMTFWERLRDSMVNAFVSTNDTISNVGSVSSRGSGVQNSGNIHYGSIS